LKNQNNLLNNSASNVKCNIKCHKKTVLQKTIAFEKHQYICCWIKLERYLMKKLCII